MTPGRPEPKRVTRTGIALVHENEVVFPAAGSEAEAERAIDDARNVVHYHFPVEIEVRGATEPALDVDRIADVVLQRLAASLT